MTYHMKDCKNLLPKGGETLGQALLCFALALASGAFIIAIGAVVVCR
jgi:hypothetical protein